MLSEKNIIVPLRASDDILACYDMTYSRSPAFCRCSDCPYIPGRKTVRAARDENGKSIQVPGDMTYDEWWDRYVDNSKKHGKMKINIQLFAKKSEDFKTVFLPEQEYAHVMSEIASN